MGIWHEIRSETLRNDVFRAFLFSNAKNNMFTGHYELTQLPIRKITNIAQKLKMLGTENPFKPRWEQHQVAVTFAVGEQRLQNPRKDLT